ncbi:DUF6011 domain-containing protein [Gordonia rhizosphera]|uniref:Uncharacterized protein n=1 Tax=Gordonia rhizosphera NBRC 16068 TaxID=1108045 RepID=K6X2X5_9ACTN|nr:DUF6011 domain-containing protein [Gordonia rhizosphera]GAB93154.1 hypothetical protein GORHZ_207_00030 [Gordonia rhizosphera NBRC 16068]
MSKRKTITIERMEGNGTVSTVIPTPWDGFPFCPTCQRPVWSKRIKLPIKALGIPGFCTHYGCHEKLPDFNRKSWDLLDKSCYSESYMREGVYKYAGNLYRVTYTMHGKNRGGLTARRKVIEDGETAWVSDVVGLRKLMADVENAERFSDRKAVNATGPLYAPCEQCGRMLTEPRSIERGIGDTCAGDPDALNDSAKKATIIDEADTASKHKKVDGTFDMDTFMELRTTVLQYIYELYGDRRGHICLGTIRDRTAGNPRGKWSESFFKYPSETGNLLDTIEDQVNLGRDVYLPTSLCVLPQRRRTVPSNVISFEVDEYRDKEHLTALLNDVRAGLISSGTPGHFHVSVLLDRDLSHEELGALGERLYRAGDISDGGKYLPNEVLRIPGTLNMKAVLKGEKPRPVLQRRAPKVISVEALESILRQHQSVIERNTPSSVGKGTWDDIDTEPVEWSALNYKARRAYHNWAEGSYHNWAEGYWLDADRAMWAFLNECRNSGLSIEQTYYAATVLDKERAGVIAAKYRPDQIVYQVNKVYGTPGRTGHKLAQ